MNLLQFCSTLYYQDHCGQCYYNARLIQRRYGWELYTNLDHVVCAIDWRYYDHTGEVTGRFIPLDPLEAERFKLMNPVIDVISDDKGNTLIFNNWDTKRILKIDLDRELENIKRKWINKRY